MRFVTYELDGRIASGVTDGESIWALEGSVLDLVRAGLPAAVEQGEAALAAPPAAAVADVRLLPPLQPPTVRDFVAFEEHVEGVVLGMGQGAVVAAQWYDAPTFYFTNPYALVGAHDDVAVPPGCERLDFECEVAVVVGPGGADLDPVHARASIFGYSVLNDWSARDLQRREMAVMLGPAKGKDFATTLGPWLVTADEVEDRRGDDGFLDLAMVVEVNGHEVGRDSLANMGWPFEELIAYASRGTEVRAGDVLGSGTCGNGGCLAELWGRNGGLEPAPLRPGDVVTMTVERLGTLRNRVVAGPPATPITPARPRPRTRPAASFTANSAG